MPTLISALLCVTIALTIFPNQSHAKLGWNKCLGEIIESSDLKSANQTCQSEFPDILGPGPPTAKKLKKAWKNYCFRICHLKKLGLVTENTDFNLTLDAKRLSAFVESTYPASVRTLINDGIMNCANQTIISTKAPKPEDKKCKSRKQLVKCIDRVLKNNCKPNDSNSVTDASNSNNAVPAQLASTPPIPTLAPTTSTPRSSRLQVEGASVVELLSAMIPEDEDDEDDDEDD